MLKDLFLCGIVQNMFTQEEGYCENKGKLNNSIEADNFYHFLQVDHRFILLAFEMESITEI